MNKNYFFLTLLFTLNIAAGVAEDLSNIQFRKFQVNEGLSENTATCIMQDRKGYLWLGTKDGLNKFDGINFTVYRNQNDEKSIGNNFIKKIVQADDHTLYIATDNGMYIMDMATETFKRLETILNLADRTITSITSLLIDKQGLLWITSMAQGVYVFDPVKIELKRIKSWEYDLTKTSIWTVFEDKSGGIWVGSRIGLLQYNPGKDLLEPVEGLIEYTTDFNKEILSIFEDPKGNLWLGTWQNGIIFYNKQRKGYSGFCGPHSKDYYITHIRAFLQYDDTNLLVGADDGLYLLNTDTKKTARVDVPYNRYSLGDQNVYSIMRDREGGIWIGTYFGGLNYLSNSVLSIEKYLPNDREGFLSGKAISQFCEDEKGNLWIATEDGGLNYFDVTTKRFSQPVQTSYHNIHPLILINNELWIGTFSRGLDVYNTITKTIRHYRNNPTKSNSINDDCVFSLYQTRSGEIYVGTTIGLNRYNPQTDDFTHIEKDSISFVYDIKEDAYHNLWVASYNKGIARRNGKTGKWTYYNQKADENDPIVNSKLTGIYIDTQKRLWLSSEGHGLFLYDYAKDRFQNISEKDGLPNNVVYGILDDQFGNIWVSSNQGLVSFPFGDIGSQKRYTQEDGLQSNEFNYKSSLKSRNGKLYFGGINGFNCFYPQNLNNNINIVTPSVEITGMQLLGRDNESKDKLIWNAINRKEPIVLTHNQASFTISFISLSYVAQSKNQYAYMLEGADSDWNHIGNNRNVTYVNLQPGKYTFRVKASNNNGIWNQTGTKVQFEILPPFWQSAPAKILYVIVWLLLALVLVKHYVKKSKTKQQSQLEAYKAEQEMLVFKSKIDFFTNIAHEIRTPVSLIKAPLEEIIQSNDGNANTRQNLSIIEKNSERLNVLINQLLDFRKMDSSEYVVHADKVNLKKLVIELYERFRKTAQSQKIDFDIAMPEKADIWAISDSDALTKIIGNFLTNALKFTNNKIVLTLKFDADDSFMVSVADNGRGIPNELKSHIFDPFYQVHSYDNKKGTGIGLFLAKHLSEVLGGKIQITDNPGGGSIFCFQFKNLPESKPEQTQPFHEKPTGVPDITVTRTDSTKHLLVVEDNVDMLHFIETSMSNEYRVDTAENAAEALTLMEKSAYDVVVTDIMMPDIDGLRFTQILRDNINYSHIPIVLLSAKTDNLTKVEGLRAGADVFIEKPFSTSYLKAQISSLLANRNAIMEAFNRSPLTSYSILATNKSDQDFLNKLNEEIDSHISDSDFSIESLTDKLFISRSNLQRKLKTICGFTPGDYLRTYRLKKAASLLLENGLRINEVAFEVGFSSPSYFTKCFVKQFGILPKEFVKQHSGTDEE
ncbi:MAG: two-component regulator propeller domain-containing protein [Breznakibacter sp.]